MAKTNKFFSFFVALCLIIIGNGVGSELIAQGVNVVIVDAGHGGSISPGATYRGVKEKNIVLPIALRVGELIEQNLEGVEVVYTRTKDVALASTIKEDLRRRNQLANSSKGDLFVSIHANAAVSSAAAGVETIIMGESSLEQQRNEAALYANNREDLLDMSDEKTAAIVRAYIQNLQFTYGEYSEALARLIQKNYGKYNRKLRNLRRQPLMVLYGADMPAVLTEIGFMTNNAEFKYMTSKKGQEEIAQSIYGGVRDYVAMINSNLAPSSAKVPEAKPTEPQKPQPTNERGYTIQLLSSRKVVKASDSQFRIYRNKVWYFEASGSYKYKYCVGRYTTKAEAQAELSRAKRYFSDAFIVTY